MKPENIWKKLEREGPGIAETGMVQYLLTPDSPVDIFLSLDLPTKKRMLILRTDIKYIYKPDNFPDLKGIDVNTGRITGDEKSLGNITLTQKDPQNSEIFSALAEDLIQVVKDSKLKKEAIKSFYSRLEDWIRFLEKYGDSGLSRERARGLFGELWFLHKYLILNNYPDSVDSWTGPERTHQDFRFSGVAVEVKTTIMKMPQKIRIASELQLDATGLTNLFLYHLSVIERAGDQLILPELVETIRRSLSSSPHGKQTFERILHSAGYLDIHVPKYSQTGYAIKNESFYLVTDAFPKLTGVDLPPGVGDLRYSVGVSECQPFLVEASSFFDALNFGCVNE